MGNRVAPDAEHTLSENIVVNKEKRGVLAVYVEARNNGRRNHRVFIEDEKDLLATAAQQVATLVGKKETKRAKQVLEQQLRRADRLAKIGQFSAGVAHEINEPLANILGFAQLALQDKGLPEQVAADLNNIVDSSLHAREIIRKLMFFSRQMPPQFVPTDLNDAIHQALRITENAARKSNIKVHCEYAADLPDVMADPQHIKQVIVNLAANAFRPWRTAGSCAWRPSTTKMTPILSWRIPDRGWTGSSSSRFSTPSTPPRMWIRHRAGIVRGPRHYQGARRVHSGRQHTGQGHACGSCLSLPSKQLYGRLMSERIRILAVDDSQSTLEVLKRNLESNGYEVFTALRVAEALSLLDSLDIDLVITDYRMPQATGLDLIRHVRDNYPDTEIMMITGYPSIPGAVEAIKDGAGEYLPKPFTAEELLTVVERIVQRLLQRRVLGSPDTPPDNFGIIGNSPEMDLVFQRIGKASSTDANVLISGDSGTGKELVARAVHYNSDRRSAPFVPVNCTAIPDSLLESELFGHVKGAFTGAKDARAGFSR